MKFDKVVEVLVICIPIFGAIALGKILEQKARFDEARRNFVNNLIYFIALPALVFRAVISQRFLTLLDPTLIICPALGVLAMLLLYLLITHMIGAKGPARASIIFGTFWANVTYMGFPLARNAFGAVGEAYAAIYNAFIIPVFILVGMLLINAFAAQQTSSLKTAARQTIKNPIVLAALLGIAGSLFSELLRDSDGIVQIHPIVAGSLQIISNFLELIGAMGLPLALLTIGASLHLGKIVTLGPRLALVVLGKLILFPLTTFGFALLLTPGATRAAIGVAVLLSSTPIAVSSYVIARKAGADEDFVASMLVLSTLLSIITIPIWVYFLI